MTATAIRQPSALRSVVQELLTAQPTFDAQRVLKAVQIFEDTFANERHWSGATMMDYTTGALQYLLQFEPDEDSIIACILNRIPRSKEWDLFTLDIEFGGSVRELVSDVHILSHVTLQGKRMTLHDLRTMMISVSSDVRTILITLAKLTQICNNLQLVEPEIKKHFCRDVLQLFAPVAARLGIYTVKNELELAAFPVLYEHDYERIQEQFTDLVTQHGQFFTAVQKDIATFLHSRNISCAVKSRTKLPYSIFMKMREKSLTHIDDIPDLFALRIIVDSEADCYQVLGLLHQHATAVPNRFKDYISFPKPNGYQSLHTTLVNVPGAPESLLFEVQVRTKTMHREAEFGVAAHWSYKEVGSATGAMQTAQLHRILAEQEVLDDGEHEQLVNHIFVLTPSGDIIELPEGATPLDFAFHIHTDLGLSFKGARVNGTIAGLQHPLENGDIVEVMKHPSQQPSEQWMHVLKTSSARSKLKHFLYAQQRPQYLAQGKKLLNDQLRKRSLPLLDSELTFLATVDAKQLDFVQREDILVKIGQGSESSSSIFERLLPTKPAIKKDAQVDMAKKTQRKIQLEGGITMPHRFAKCCKPSEVYGAIIGLVNRSGTIMIHRKQCKMIANANKEKMLKAKFL